MSDKANFLSWAEGVPAPVDRDGNVVPLVTRMLYDAAGRKFEVMEISFVYSVIGECQTWRVRRPNGLSMALDLCHLERPDSWEQLLKDLDRAADTNGAFRDACYYLTGDVDTECVNCKSYKDGRWCTQTMTADIARRIRELREADDAD